VCSAHRLLWRVRLLGSRVEEHEGSWMAISCRFDQILRVGFTALKPAGCQSGRQPKRERRVAKKKKLGGGREQGETPADQAPSRPVTERGRRLCEAGKPSTSPARRRKRPGKAKENTCESTWRLGDAVRIDDTGDWVRGRKEMRAEE